MATVFVPDPVSWEREFRSWTGIVGRHLTKVITRGAILAAASAPGPGKPPRNRTGINYSTGALEASIVPQTGRWGTELEGRVVALPKHALFVHEGTSPHSIFPRPSNRSGKLVFFWAKKGHVVALNHVNHPGTQPVPFLSENLRRMV